MTTENPKSADELKDVSAANIARPMDHSPGGSPSQSNPDLPGTSVEDQQASNAAAGAANQDISGSGVGQAPGSRVDNPDLSNTAAGNIARPMSHSTGGTPAQPNPDLPGASLEDSAASNAAAGNIARPMSHSTGGTPAQPNPDLPGASLEDSVASNAAAGVNVSADASAGGTPDPIVDPPYDPPSGGRHDSGNVG